MGDELIYGITRALWNDSTRKMLDAGHAKGKLIRKETALDDVKIICISGMVEEEKVVELRAAGANDFLRKPFEVEKLIDLMCAQLDMEPIPTKG